MIIDEAAGMTGEHQIGSAWQGMAKSLKRLSTHNNYIAHCLLPEPPEIVRQMPRDFSVRANHAV
jgi:hypothetical protein